MIDAIIHIAMAALVIGLVYWAYTQLITLVPVPAPVMTVLNVVVVVLLVLALISYVILPLLGLLGGGSLHLSR